jgi:hypothetical protein
VVYPVPTNEATTTESQRYNYFIRTGGHAITRHACPEAVLPLDLPCSGPVTRPGDISITGKPKKKLDESSKDDTKIKKGITI